MAVFCIEIAEVSFQVTSLFESTKDYCKNYLTEKEPDFSLEVFPEDLVFEQNFLDQEAKEEGLKRRKFSLKSTAKKNRSRNNRAGGALCLRKRIFPCVCVLPAGK